MEGRTVFLKMDTSDLDNQIARIKDLISHFEHTHSVFQEQMVQARNEFREQLTKDLNKILTPLPTNARIKSLIAQVVQLEETRVQLIADIEGLTKLKEKLEL